MALTVERAAEVIRPARRFIAPLVVGIPVLLIVLATLGALTQQDIPGLPVVPGLTLWGLPLDIWVRDAATAITLGGALIGGVLAPRPDPWIGRMVSLAALVWLMTLAAQAVLTVSEVLAVPLETSIDPTIIWSLLSQTTLGQVILIQAALVAIVAVLGWVVLDRVTGMIILTAVAVAAFLPGFTGHSGIADGHEAATISLGVHLLAASAWIGGLIATTSYLARRAPDGEIVLRRFSTVALISVILLAESGMLNASLRIDGPAALITSQYGSIILTKVAVLILLIGYGWRARVAMSAGRGVPSVLRFATLEIAWFGAVLGLSVALSRTAPPAAATSGDVIPMSALIVLGLAIPLACAMAVPHVLSERVGQLRAYPEALGAVLVFAMVLFGMFSTAGFLPVQLLALAAIFILPALGWIFWDSMLHTRSVGAVLLMAFMLPLAAWWIERDVTGGLELGTWVTVALGIGLVCASAFLPKRVLEEVPQ